MLGGEARGLASGTARARRAGSASVSRRAVVIDSEVALSMSTTRLSAGAFVVVMLACSGLRLLLDGAGWWFELTAVSLVVMGSAAATRAFTPRRFAPPLVAIVALVMYVTARFAADTAILGLLPTTSTAARFSELSGAAVSSIHNQAIPATVDGGILLFLVSGVGLFAFLVDLTVLTLRAPAFAGIPLLAILAVPAMTDFNLSDGFSFALTAAGYLWLLRTNRQRRRLRFSLTFGAVLILGSLIVPAVLPATPASGGSGGSLVSTGLDPMLDLGHDLRTPSKTTALVYTTATGEKHYLRLVTLENFSGAAWVPDVPKQKRSHTVSSFAPPVGLSSKVAVTKETTTISIRSFTSPWLPVPYPTSEISGLSGDWYWESGSLAVSSPSGTVQGQIYQVRSIIPRPTPKQLSAAGSVVPKGFDKFLSLPATLPAIISDTARQVTSEESGNYAKAIALQQYFRGSQFDYSERAPVEEGYDGTGMDVIAKFLTVKSGYCIHFASAMAVMARSLGIPARVAVGFQPGSSYDTGFQGGDTYEVTSHDFHAWPELYFDGIGWVPFEPTPGRGSLPSYADLSMPGVPAPNLQADATPQPTESAAAAPGEGRRPDQPGDAGVAQSSGAQVLAAWLWVLGVVGLVALLLSIPAFLRAWRRARRLGAATAGGAWRELLAMAEDVGLRLPATMTPREAAVALGPRAGGGALDRLRGAVERESYAAPGAVTVERADVRDVTARLVGSASRRDRVLARLAPASVWRRMLRKSG